MYVALVMFFFIINHRRKFESINIWLPSWLQSNQMMIRFIGPVSSSSSTSELTAMLSDAARCCGTLQSGWLHFGDFHALRGAPFSTDYWRLVEILEDHRDLLRRMFIRLTPFWASFRDSMQLFTILWGCCRDPSTLIIFQGCFKRSKIL